ncbi:sulfurtransferase [Halocalculus aciditolerans]|uniref:Thiosulfate sulfurtransferase n=1 Tax=Halocalculus aciditolerans TaxID=1383812 RepID=A0A830F6P3_9EURY|nr:rhodanese-like domain-containing protein [Halocalculus aciditolerans]GGL46197.1 thiosulfate sulfurtransferase [Halocalculus aciditolerans]
MDEDVVVSAEWLAAHRDDPDVVVVDVRDNWEYDGIGHVPGAVNIPFDAFRAVDADGEGGEGMLPDPDEWRALLESRGVEPSDTLVAYDDTHGVFAARFLVTALVMGHEREGELRFLDGDYSAWTREHPVESGSVEVEESVYEVERPAETPLVDVAAVAAAVESGAVVVDTRSPEEYAEGHVPGAVNLDWRELVDEESRGLKPREAVEAVLASKGVERGEEIVLYCNTARRISHTYVVLRWLGFEDVAFFEGSMTAWEAAGRPTERN